MHFFVAKLLSIAVMTYTYVNHLQHLRPSNLLRTQRMNFSMRPQHVRITRDPAVVIHINLVAKKLGRHVTWPRPFFEKNLRGHSGLLLETCLSNF